MKNSQDLVKDFYAGQLRRMKRLMLFLATMLIVTLGFLLWIKADTAKSNHRLVDVLSTVKKDQEHFRQQQDDSDKNVNQLKEDNAKQTKLITCLLAIHGENNLITPEAQDSCKKTVDDSNAALPFNSTPSVTAPAPSSSTTNNTSPAAPPQPSQSPQPQPVTVTTPLGTISICIPFTSICVDQ